MILVFFGLIYIIYVRYKETERLPLPAKCFEGEKAREAATIAAASADAAEEVVADTKASSEEGEAES